MGRSSGVWMRRRRRGLCSGKGWRKAKGVGKEGCVSRAGTRHVPLDWMLDTGQRVQAGCLWTM